MVSKSSNDTSIFRQVTSIGRTLVILEQFYHICLNSSFSCQSRACKPMALMVQWHLLASFMGDVQSPIPNSGGCLLIVKNKNKKQNVQSFDQEFGIMLNDFMSRHKSLLLAKGYSAFKLELGPKREIWSSSKIYLLLCH